MRIDCVLVMEPVKLYLLIQVVLSFLWKHDTFLAVYCTLLSNSYLAIYL